jgi:hypothetical protein
MATQKNTLHSPEICSAWKAVSIDVLEPGLNATVIDAGFTGKISVYRVVAGPGFPGVGTSVNKITKFPEKTYPLISSLWF